jgi:hypothetical protein
VAHRFDATGSELREENREDYFRTHPCDYRVTGDAGYIGSQMVRELADAGKRAVALDNLSTGFDSAVAKDMPLVIGDTGDQNLLGL